MPLFPSYNTHTTHSTLTDSAPSIAPGCLNVTHSLPTTAKLSWTLLPMEKQNGIITGYTVQVEGPDSSREVSVPNTSTTSVEVPGLMPFTSYTFSVSAMTKAGTGPAATISSTTPEGGKKSIRLCIS